MMELPVIVLSWSRVSLDHSAGRLLAHRRALRRRNANRQEKKGPSSPKELPGPRYRYSYACLGTNTDAAFAASCSLLEDRWAYRIETFGSL